MKQTTFKTPPSWVVRSRRRRTARHLRELTADPSKAAGLDAAVKTLGQAPFGKFLLIAAALGLAAFGAYGFVRSRHGRM